MEGFAPDSRRRAPEEGLIRPGRICQIDRPGSAVSDPDGGDLEDGPSGVSAHFRHGQNGTRTAENDRLAAIAEQLAALPEADRKRLAAMLAEGGERQ